MSSDAASLPDEHATKDSTMDHDDAPVEHPTDTDAGTVEPAPKPDFVAAYADTTPMQAVPGTAAIHGSTHPDSDQIDDEDTRPRGPGIAKLTSITAAVVLASVAALMATDNFGARNPAPEPAPSAAAPLDPRCERAFTRQQDTTRATPTSDIVADAGLLALPVVGRAANGLCLASAHELQTPGWKVRDVEIAASRPGRDPLVAHGSQPVLFTPAAGCVTLTWTYHLTGPRNATGTWTASDTHGATCD